LKRKALQVTLDVRAPSVVELTVGNKVQLDRLAPSSHGHVAERHGSLLDPGGDHALARTRILFLQGRSLIPTSSPSAVGVGATTSATDPKTDPPEQSKVGSPPQPSARGDEASGDTPILTVE